MSVMKDLNPLVSVIIPTYNRADVLDRAIESVLNQTYENFELIIIDDGSTDKTFEQLAKYESSTKVQTFSINNHGVSFARNLGIKKASGEFIAFLDSDDEWLAHKLASQMDYLKNYPEVNWIHTEEIWIRNGVRVNPMKKHQKGGGDQFLASIDLCLISPSTVLLKKELLLEEGGFDETYPVCEDYNLWLDLSLKHPIGFISEACIRKYGGHEDQLSRKYFAMDYYRVKTLDRLLKTKILNKDQFEKTKSVLLKKSKILLKGFIKHNNLIHYDEVLNIQNFHK